MTRPAGAREAALLVHGLPDAARAQVLERLSDDERAAVLPLLQELRALGIPALPHDGTRAAAAPVAAAGVSPRVAALGAHAVARGLSRCAPATAAHVWGAGPWPWKDAVLELLDAPRRNAVRRWLDAGAQPLAPRMTEALLAQLLSAVSADAEAPTAASRESGRKWWTWKR